MASCHLDCGRAAGSCKSDVGWPWGPLGLACCATCAACYLSATAGSCGETAGCCWGVGRALSCCQRFKHAAISCRVGAGWPQGPLGSACCATCAACCPSGTAWGCVETASSCRSAGGSYRGPTGGIAALPGDGTVGFGAAVSCQGCCWVATCCRCGTTGCYCGTWRRCTACCSTTTCCA